MLGLGITVLALGVIYGVPVMVVGAAVVLFSVFGWVLEPSVAEPIDFEGPTSGSGTKEIAPLG
jgi:hypothetical protein